MLKDETRARWGDIGLFLGASSLGGVFASLMLGILLSPLSRAEDVLNQWWHLPLAQLPEVPWTEIALGAIALPTSLVIAVAVGPQTSETSSGRPVPVSEVVRAEVVSTMATMTALGSSVLLWTYIAFVPRTAGGGLLALCWRFRRPTVRVSRGSVDRHTASA